MSIILMQSQVKKSIVTGKMHKITYFFLENRWRPFFIFHFPYNVMFLLNIALILLDVHYFDAESSEKNQLLQAKSTKLLIF